MRTRTERESPDPDLAAGLLDDTTGAGTGGRGALARLGWTIALPVRLAGGLVGLVVLAVAGVVRAIMFPIRLAVTLTAKVVQLASDVVYGIWRVVLGVVGAVLGLFRLVVRAFNATIGAVFRLVIGTIGRVLRALLWVFSLGRISGARKARKDAEKAAEGDAVVELED